VTVGKAKAKVAARLDVDPHQLWVVGIANASDKHLLRDTAVQSTDELFVHISRPLTMRVSGDRRDPVDEGEGRGCTVAPDRRNRVQGPPVRLRGRAALGSRDPRFGHNHTPRTDRVRAGRTDPRKADQKDNAAQTEEGLQSRRRTSGLSNCCSQTELQQESFTGRRQQSQRHDLQQPKRWDSPATKLYSRTMTMNSMTTLSLIT
jgi:hypothetical protein